MEAPVTRWKMPKAVPRDSSGADLPRLSVDIDLVYVPIEARAESLRAIDSALDRILVSAERRIPGSRGARTAGGGNPMGLDVGGPIHEKEHSHRLVAWQPHPRFLSFAIRTIESGERCVYRFSIFQSLWPVTRATCSIWRPASKSLLVPS